MHNVSRDFQKQIMHENGPFSRPFFCGIRLDMTNKKYVMTISTEKGRKCMTQIFDFWKFITVILAKLNERFSKIMKLRKIYKMAHILGHFSTRYDWIWQIKISHGDQHGKRKKMYVSDFSFLKFHLRDFVKLNERFSIIIK